MAEDVEITEEKEENKQKTRKKVKKIKKKKSRKSINGEEKEPNEEDQARLKTFQQSDRSLKRKSSTLSLEVEKMSQGKPLTHFQVVFRLFNWEFFLQITAASPVVKST